MKCRYILLETVLGTRTGFGIAAVCDCDETAIVLQSFIDLCSEQQTVAAFVDRCNTLDLSLCHLQDAVDDFLAEL